MKIGLVVPGFSADETDWCIPVLLDTVRTLARTHEVHVFTLRYPPVARTYKVHGATVHSLGGRQVGGLGRLPLLGRAVRAIAGEERRGRFDLFHGFWADEPGSVAVLAGALLGGRPTVVSAAGGELVSLPEIGYGGQRSRFNRWLTRFALGRADVVTAGSYQLLDMLAKYRENGPVRHVPLGVDIARFRQHPQKSDTAIAGESPSLLAVASLTPIKDHVTLLAALARLGERTTPTLQLAGDGPLRPALTSEAARLGLSTSVRFLGHILHDALPSVYRQAQVVVVSSRFESQSMATLEALAVGVPVAGTRVGLLPELIDSRFLAAPGDVGGLADALAAACEASVHPEGTGVPSLPAAYTLAGSCAAFARLYQELATR